MDDDCDGPVDEIEGNSGFHSGKTIYSWTAQTAAVSYQIVLTKADKIKAPALEKLLDAIKAQIIKRPASYPVVLATSSQKHDGLDELRAEITSLF